MTPRSIRVTLAKQGDMRFLSHLDVIRALKRAFVRGRVPAAMSQGFNPQIRLVFLAPLPVGVASRCEVFHFDLESPLPADDVARRLNEGLPPGLDVVSAEECAGERVRHFECEFRVEGGGEPFPGPDDVARFLSAGSARAVKRLGPKAAPGETARTVDVRPFVSGAEVAPDGALRVRILTLEGRTVRAEDVVAAISGEAARDRVAYVEKTSWRPVGQDEAEPLLATIGAPGPGGPSPETAGVPDPSEPGGP